MLFLWLRNVFFSLEGKLLLKPQMTLSITISLNWKNSNSVVK